MPRSHLEPVQALWVGSRLSDLERLSLASFVANGHAVHLYAYEEIEDVPAGVEVLDARSILPEASIFRAGTEVGEGEGSLAPFADLFRYKLLCEKGGWWVDMDLVCLRPFDFDAAYVFGHYDKVNVNGAALRLPAGSPLAESLYRAAEAKGRTLVWGDLGPVLLTDKVRELGLGEFGQPVNVFYPVDYHFAAWLFREDDRGWLNHAVESAHAVHFWNEVLRRKSIDKNGSYPASSIYEQLKRRFGIETRASEQPA